MPSPMNIPSGHPLHPSSKCCIFILILIFQASPAASTRSPRLPGPQVVFSRWDLTKTLLPSRKAPIHVRTRGGDSSPPQSTLSPSAAMLGEAQKHPLYPHCRRGGGGNLLLFLVNDMPESYRALATQLSITASQGGARTQGKTHCSSGKIYHTRAA